MCNHKSIWLTAVCTLALVFLPGGLAKGQANDAGSAPATFSVKVTGTGQPMILIPGLSCGGTVWNDTVAHFKDHYECHVLTLAGFAGQPAVAGPFLGKVRADIAKYIKDKNLDHPIIIGHSLGGFMALWLGATIPKQVGPIISVDGLPFLAAIFNPAATVASVQGMAESYRAQYAAQTPEAFMAANRAALTGMITDPKNVDFVDATGKNSNPKAVGQAFYDLMTTDLRPILKNIQSPTLLIGATAAMTDPQQKAAVEGVYRQELAAIPHHTLVFAPKARHFIQLDEPDYFYTQVENFLKAQDVSGAK